MGQISLRIPLVFVLLISFFVADAQQQGMLTLDSCYAKAERNYPLVRQMSLIEKSRHYSISNANKGFLPQLNIAGQATYQSAVTSLPISLPGTNITPLSKDQYKLYGEVAQPLTDLVTVKNQRDLVDVNSQIEKKKTEVELYKIKECINNLYFGILLIDAKIAQTNLLKKDIESGIAKTKIAIANGIALRSSADNLEAEILKADQHIIELKANRKAYLNMLSLFINEKIAEHTKLETPPVVLNTQGINREELKLIDLQKNALNVQDKLITTKNLPKFSLFFQGGVGRPALNFLSNDFKTYYIGGLRLNWHFTNLYTAGKERKLIDVNRKALDVQKEVFLFNTNMALEQQNTEVEKVKELIGTDNDIITLRERISETTKNQLEYGTATSNDYITAVNAEDQAKQNLLIHRIQLQLAQYTVQTTSGN